MTEGELIPKNQMSREEIDKIVELWTEHDKGPRDYIKVERQESELMGDLKFAAKIALSIVGILALTPVVTFFIFFLMNAMLEYLQKG